MKKFGIFFFLWFAFAPLLLAWPALGDDPFAYCAQAIRLRSEKQYAEAIKVLNRAIQINPRSAELYFLRADSYQKCNKYDNATADLKIAMKLDPKNVAYIYQYTKVGDVTNNVYQSIDGDTRRLVLDPAAYLIFQDRAEKFRMINQFDSAYFDHSRAIVLATTCKAKDKQIADLYKRRGQTLAWFKKYDRALADFTKALELNPNDIAMHTNRAYVLIALGQKQKAVADLSMAIEHEKKTNALLNDLAERGHLYCDLKDFPKALTDANRMVSLESEYIDGYRLRATVYEGMGKHDLAKKDHDTAAKLGADWVLPKS